MKPYLIYLDINQTIDCSDKPTRDVATKARSKALEVAKKQFTTLFASTFKSKEAKICKEQTITDAVAIEINEKQLEQVLPILVGMPIVSVIDTFAFTDLPAAEILEEVSAQDKMSKFLK